MTPPRADATTLRHRLAGRVPVSVRLLWPFVRPRAAALAALVLLGVGMSFAEGVTVTLVATALGAIVGGVAPPPLLGALGHSAPRLLLVAIALVGSRAGLGAVFRLVSDTVAASLDHDIRIAIYARFVTAPFGVVSRRGTGALLNTLEWEALSIPEAVGASSAIAMDAIAIATYGVLLLVLSWRLLLVSVVLALLAAPLSALTTRRLRHLSEAMRATYEAVTAANVSTLQALRTVRLFGAEDHVRRRHRDVSGRLRRATVAIARQNAAASPVRQLTMLAVGLLILLTVARLRLAHGDALAAIALLYRTAPHGRAIEGSVTHLLGNAGRLRNTLASLLIPVDDAPPPPARTAPDGDAAISSFERITFAGVAFRYGDAAEPVLDGIDLVIRRGSFTAVTGPSGGGKTTIVNLLGRLHAPTGGTILVDDRPLAAIPTERWLALASFAGQDVELIGGTVADNLRLGRPIPDDALWDALEIAHAAPFVRLLPDGLATAVGDRGTRLSGGQRQRLVLARALARRPKLLVLDEATNAVDPDMERSIYDAIRTRRPDLTILGVTHRGETAIADAIVTIDLGRVVRVATGGIGGRGASDTAARRVQA